MDNLTVLVLANPTDRELALLEELPAETTLAVGNSPEAFGRTAPEADVMVIWSASAELARQVFAMCPRVRWVHSRSAGVDGVLFPELVESPVPVTNASGVFSQPLGEFALAAILYFAKDFRRMIRSQEAGLWDPFDMPEISGQTVGILGYGDIGRTVAARAHAMGMRVVALRRHVPAQNADTLVDRVYGPDGRLEMIARSDYIVAAAPLTAETRGMVGEPEFGVMKRDAVVINVGRGPVIDEAAMVRALTGGRIKGAALDVFDTEPLPAGHPLYNLRNVLLSPHCADHTPDWLERAMRFFIRNFERFRQGEPLLNVINKKLGY